MTDLAADIQSNLFPPFDKGYFDRCKSALVESGLSPQVAGLEALLIQWPDGDRQSKPGPLHQTAKFPGPPEQPVDPTAPDPKSYAVGDNPLSEAFAGGGSYTESKHPRGAKGSSDGGRFISKGDSGDSVSIVQRATGAKADGKFGESTKQAVMSFQRKHGLQVDGVVGRQTAAAIAGQKNAASVTPGALSKSDSKALRRFKVAEGENPLLGGFGR